MKLPAAPVILKLRTSKSVSGSTKSVTSAVRPGRVRVVTRFIESSGTKARLEVQLARIFAALTEFQGPSVEPPGSEPAPSGNA